MRAKVISIAGSDSSGGAGIQADLRTMERIGVDSGAVITSVTAQSSQGVARIDHQDSESVRAQLRAALEGTKPGAIKIGMPGSAETIRVLAEVLARSEIFVVCDPVVSASSGGRLIDPAGQQALIDAVFPLSNLITPNLPEAETLLCTKISTDEEIEKAGASLLRLGPASVLIKGGHRERAKIQDYWTNGTESFWLTGNRVEGEGSRGTGCVVSSAIASFCALGMPLGDSLVLAKAYVSEGLRSAAGPGSATRPVDTGGRPSDPRDFPWVTSSAEAGRDRVTFPPCDPPPTGLYPILPDADWVERLASAGLSAMQIRMKDPSVDNLESQVQRAIDLTKNKTTRLYINDHWEPAIKYGAYGVHLGQDDMDPEALRKISNAGLRLGLSTHSFFELARARSVNPSYVAIGTLFHTNSKVMDYEPLGLERFKQIASLSPVPVVAIGGIRLEHADAVRAAGATGLAVISEVTESPDPEKTIRNWKEIG
jgi:hydroxymethylpyrimidine kinase/phosphomethylpyrimidine kinase/thiamine-phosphate diphosphorylase